MDPNISIKKTNQTTIYAFAIFFAILTAVGGFFLGIYMANSTRTNYNPWGLPNAPKSIITTQQATARGQIVGIGSNSVTIQSDAGDTATFKLASDYQVYAVPTTVPGQNPTEATPPAAIKDPSLIKLGQTAYLNLRQVGGDYEIFYISIYP